jgi:large repetitive protein
MKTKLSLLLLMFLTIAVNVSAQFTPQTPDLRLCGSPPNYYLNYFNCTSNNYTLDQVYLSLTDVNGVPLTNTTCVPGSTQQMYIMLNYTSNANSNINNARIFADLSIDGTIIPLNVWLGTVTPGSGQRLLFGPFDWVCGQEIQLNRILVVWTTNNPNLTTSYTCNSYNKSQCEFPTNTLVAAPLAVQFNYKACTVGNQVTVSFNSTTNGGIPPYSYAWDFDNNGTTDSTQQNPTFTYNSLSGSTAKLTVTDSQGLSNTFIQNIVSPQEIQLSATTVSPGCTSENQTGSIDLSVIGGTPGFTYLWSNNATTQNLNNVPAGNYTVTVTDSFGCQKQLTVTIQGGDNDPPVLTAPTSIIIDGCGTEFTHQTPPFSQSENSITIELFNQLGGTVSDDSVISNILYTDTFSGSCPTVITRTFKAIDGCNNFATAIQLITVQDTTAPAFVEALPGDQTVECSDVPAAVVLTATDNCGTANVSFNESTQEGTCAGAYTITRTWTATDACGNETSHTQTITVQDTTAPAFVETLPGDQTVECSDVPAAVVLTATDNCGTADVSFNESTQEGACAGAYTITRTWTATDACGNETSHTQTITVQDTTAPAFVETLPGDQTVECSDVPAAVVLTATDNCGTADVSFNESTQEGACAGAYTITRTWTATDACGNETSHTQTITVQDTTAPAFVEALPGDQTVECSDVPAAVVLTATDNCGTANVSFNESTQEGTCAGAYTITRTWTATDACGNETSHTQTITVQDTTAPAFVETLPGDQTVECSDVPAAVVLTATDNCGTANVSFNESTQEGACAGAYTITRTWTATDACGNETSHTQTITVQDTTAPAFVENLPGDSTVECSDVPAAVVLTATDNCGTANVSFNESTQEGACAGAYTITRTWTATDACGNETSHTQTITVQDTTAPAFVETLPGDQTVECSDVPAAVVLTATDNCGTANVSFNESTQEGACAGAYTITRTWTATDACGNETSHTQTITVQDTTAPAFVETLPGDQTVECSDVPAAVVLTATDNCGTANVSFNESTQEGACAGAYTITRTWTATDACGNETSHTQTITVQDTTAPAFVENLPGDSTVECSDVPAAVVLTATDNCGTANVSFNESTQEGACAGAYTITRTWTATDACGNETSHTQTITVQDTTAPAFVENLPGDSTVECSDVPAAVVLTATDNCGTANVSFNESTQEGACAGAYTITRTWTATDACGNETSHTQTITVQDTTAPAFVENLPGDSTVECSDVPAAVVLTATDNCGTANVSFNESTQEGACAGAYTITRTWTATDACGNETSHTQTITVQDTTAPAFVETLPGDQTVECSDVPAAVVLTATDNCGTANVSFNESTQEGACAGAYTITRTWTATDACGNETSHTQTITVQDTTAPAFVENLPGDSTVECSDVPAAVVLTATDNCGTANVSFNESTQEGACAGAYTITRTWTATDACGNETSHTQTITVQDTTAPAFVETLPGDQTVECSDVPAAVVLTATDNCGTANVSFNESTQEGTCAGAYTITRTWTATDACGNETSHTQTITVQDTTAPAFVENLPGDQTVECSDVPAAVVLTATDNCGTANVSFNESTQEGTCAGAYTITRTWTATDACGNETSHTQTITVQDTTPPVFDQNFPNNISVECDNIPEPMILTATDNCSAVNIVYFQNIVPGDCPNRFTIIRIWTATDACGNTALKKQTINVDDTTPPVFVEELPGDSTVECSDVPAAVVLTATDNCGTANVSFNESTQEGACAGAYTITRTWTATDACGNETSHTQTITVQDTIAPAFVEALPGDQTVECSDVPAAVVLTATDNCGTANVSFNESTQEGACAGAYTITRTWTATDACGNETSHTQTITVQDTTAPTFVENLPGDQTVECSDVPAAVVLTATDNCGTANVSFNESTQEGACAGAYTITRTWTATDACGNETSRTQTITVQDTTAPVITNEASNISVECDGTGNQNAINNWLNNNGGATATDNCSDVSWSNDFDALSNDCSTAIVVIFTATDDCGNTSTTSASFIVNDTEAPVAPSNPTDLTFTCTQEVPEANTLTALDACTGEIQVQGVDTITPGSCENNYIITRTWTFVDACGNSAVTTQTITVQDTTAPAFVETLPGDQTVECSDVPAAVVLTATDNCGTANVSFNESTQEGACAGAYTITRTWTATDACGNETSHTQTITVQDTTAPAFVEALPGDQTVECSDVPAAVVLTATDNCGTANVSFNESTQEGTCAGAYTITRTWTATDACGNETSHTQTITVQDTTAPAFVETLPGDQTVECSDVPAAVVLTATDNCGTADVSFNESTQEGACAGAYTITRTWTATDACGNETSHTQTITVQDTTAPAFVETLPGDQTVECSDVPAAVVLTATDNCGTADVSFNESTQEGACAGAYTITRTWTATDACGNETSHTQTITVQDTTAPAFVENSSW